MGAAKIPVWSLSLGCPKNRVDSERLLGSLGVPVKEAQSPGKSKLVFINTCAFIEPATRESIRAILDMAKKISRLKTKPLFVVGGCLPGRYEVKELAREIPEVDLWLKPQDMQSWPQTILSALNNQTLKPEPGRLLSTPGYAWLKIGDGCRHRCSFCAIPGIKGPLCSAPSEQILAEADEMLKKGVHELVLVAQDVSAWGMDFDSSISGPRNLPSLLEKLAILPGLKWLRLLYLYPDNVTDDLLRCMRDIGEPILPYLDIPLQHSEKEILKKMGRPFGENPRALLEKIRNYLPRAALRSTLITGFPGETEADFQKMADFVREAQFENLGVFAFHAEEGTRAAQMPDQIPDDIKAARRNELMEIQAQISAEKLLAWRGKNMAVLVEESLENEWPGLYKGRVWFQAPEVDGITYVSGAGVKTGAFLKCDIEDSLTYDLAALA